MLSSAISPLADKKEQRVYLIVPFHYCRNKPDSFSAVWEVQSNPLLGNETCIKVQLNCQRALRNPLILNQKLKSEKAHYILNEKVIFNYNCMLSSVLLL